MEIKGLHEMMTLMTGTIYLDNLDGLVDLGDLVDLVDIVAS